MRVFLILVTTTILLTPWPAVGEEIRIAPEGRRNSTWHPRLSEVATPRDAVTPQQPQALRIRDGGMRRPPIDHNAVDIDRQARRSVGETVAHASREAARGHFEVGFWQGLHDAFDDPYLGDEARASGFRDGHYDPEAEGFGWQLGGDAAEAQAEELARAEVEAQFRDLSREPRPSPRSPSIEPAFGLPRAVAPALRSVFEAMPYGGSHSIDPWRVYRCTSFRDLYRGDWSDSEKAFRIWEKEQGSRSYWHQLDAAEKGRFRVVFLYEYSVAMADRADKLRRTHRRGFRDGWHHGARLQAEWSYRQGYHEGFEVALSEASDRGFHQTFAPRYDTIYRQLFRDWSTQPRPEILAVSLADSNDDGIFEPGEELLVSYEIANFGGAGAKLPLLYGSGVTPGVAELTVELPRRSVVRGPRALRLSIAGTTPARTESAAFVEIAGTSPQRGAQPLRRQAPFRVAYPLELETPVRLVGHDAISGRVSLAVGLVNRSRHRVPAAATLLADGRVVEPTRPLTALDPGAALELRYEIGRLEPLELLAGDARFVVEATSAGKLHDELTYRAPALATRLEDPALVDYLLTLARGEGSPTEVAKAHELMMQRLRVDWQRAAAGDGNPYRVDRKRATAETALGGLVSAFRTHHTSLAEPRVFTELAPRIEALAGDLPGAHPFLRSQMKKLARQLDRS